MPTPSDGFCTEGVGLICSSVVVVIWIEPFVRRAGARRGFALSSQREVRLLSSRDRDFKNPKPSYPGASRLGASGRLIEPCVVPGHVQIGERSRDKVSLDDFAVKDLARELREAQKLQRVRERRAQILPRDRRRLHARELSSSRFPRSSFRSSYICRELLLMPGFRL